MNYKIGELINATTINKVSSLMIKDYTPHPDKYHLYKAWQSLRPSLNAFINTVITAFHQCSL